MIDQTYTDVRKRYAFRKPDGTWMRIETDTMPNCMWAEWTANFEDAKLFDYPDGYSGDHRWKDMVADSVVVAFDVTTTKRYVETSCAS